MIDLSLCVVIFAMIFKAVMWGIAENRQFRDHYDGTVQWIGHLSTYHGWMFYFFAVLNIGFANAFPVPWYVKLLIFIFLMVWDIFGLDLTWWINRFMDISNLGKTWSFMLYLPDMSGNGDLIRREIVIWKFPEWNFYDKGKGKRWHEDTDWDAGGFGQYRLGRLHCYKWWVWCTVALAILVATIFYLVF